MIKILVVDDETDLELLINRGSADKYASVNTNLCLP